MKTLVIRFLALCLSITFLSQLAAAKRVNPKPVAPVEANGTRYSAVGDGKSGFVVASDMATGKQLWKARVFRVAVNPLKEGDNQWVFITDLKLARNVLLVRHEQPRCFQLNLDDQKVAKISCAAFSEPTGATSKRFTKRVILPNLKLVRCVRPECLQPLDQAERPRPGDIYPEHIDVAYLDQWCPAGVSARYNKAVSFDDLKDALEKRYGKGTPRDWTGAPLLTWDLKGEIFIQLRVAEKTISQAQHVEEGTRTIHYSDMSKRLYCTMQ